jgi:transcriptional regulator with XRE-family HTH domain
MELARCSGLDQSYLRRIELGIARPSLNALVVIGACLGADPSVRYFPRSGPRIHDRFQAPMIEALLGELGREWRGQPERPVPAARGVVDVVLMRAAHLLIACECHSELRRLELVVRRLHEKAEALRGEVEPTSTVSTMLLLRSTAATRAVVKAYETTLAAAFPARSADAVAALRDDAAWPGPAIVWARLDSGRAEILDRPPRGVRLGR